MPCGFTEEKAINQALQFSLNEHGGEEKALLAQSKEEDMSNDQFTELLKAHASSQISGSQQGIHSGTSIALFQKNNLLIAKAQWKPHFPPLKRRTMQSTWITQDMPFYTYSWVLSAMIARLSQVLSMIAFVFYFNLSLR